MDLQQAKNLIKQYPGQFYTYILKRPDGRPFYVGKGNCKGFRIEAHGKEALSNKCANSYKRNVIRKIWEDGGQIDYEIALFTHDVEMAFDKEIELIHLYGRKDKKTGVLANMTDGGEDPPDHTGEKHSEETKSKMSIDCNRKGLF